VLLNSATSPGVAGETAGGWEKEFGKLIEDRAVNVDAIANGRVTKDACRHFGCPPSGSCSGVDERIRRAGVVRR
jgi:hypothetical protein